MVEQRTAPPASVLTGATLFLDFDGTLVEIAPRPKDVVADDALRALIRALLVRLDGRVAIISGRSVKQIRDLFGDLPCAVAGSHGAELHWPDGRHSRAERPAGLDVALAEMRMLAERYPGALVEDKPLGAAFHFRQAPQAEQDAAALAERLAATHGLRLQPGKMVFEVRVPGSDKGAALRTLMADPTMADGRPLFLGDDDTDEPAFVAAAALGGDGVLIGGDRPSAARFRLGDVSATLRWLQDAR